LRRHSPVGGFVLHGLVAVWLPVEPAPEPAVADPGEVGDAEGGVEEAPLPRRWVLLDPHGDNDEVATVFRIDPPSLAFEADPEQGEALLPTLLARPAKRVVDLLDYADSLARIRNHLPDSIDS
jgi:hypothetical protein